MCIRDSLHTYHLATHPHRALLTGVGDLQLAAPPRARGDAVCRQLPFHGYLGLRFRLAIRRYSRSDEGVLAALRDNVVVAGNYGGHLLYPGVRLAGALVDAPEPGVAIDYTTAVRATAAERGRAALSVSQLHR